MRALIFIEHSNGIISESALEMAALASSIGLTCQGLVCVGDSVNIDTLVKQLCGFESVIAIANPALTHYNPEAALLALVTATELYKPDLVMTSYSTVGVDLAAACALKSDLQMLGYVSGLDISGKDLVATSQIYGGKLVATTTMSMPAVIAVMPGAMKAAVTTSSSPTVTIMDLDMSNLRTHVKEIIAPDTSSINLADAEKIICVGRGLGAIEKLPLAQTLATILNAEIAGSRPVIDAGWLPKVRQVGKSGIKVKPKLYLMAGVSGAPEHLEGMDNSELIIAINSDEQAPIFNKAHYGVVGDMFQILSALTSRLQGKS
ncbi:electron transfer flavoprotein subunit alpha/FixB family protein [Amylibacter sp.]|jgi:electron transfer flavoprotein alpha subunit|nr:electron transfer flavoprotein subunit alpha/FixB family protein [Amylibacter sp.]|tara:strand:- start:567 stop:1520 length:954 start_codon:yes stop_codon:yes gene_type:complete